MANFHPDIYKYCVTHKDTDPAKAAYANDFLTLAGMIERTCYPVSCKYYHQLVGIPMSTFLIRGLMDSIPMELEEAAYIDGCGFFARFWHIILPLSRTGIVTAATFEFLTCWNEFVFANLIVSSEKLRTIQVGIRYFTNQFSTDYVSMYAAIVLSIIPSILGYVLFQEQIISGMTSGAVKG